MKIKSIEIGENNVLLKTPFKTALRTAEYVESVIVKLTTDTGLVGYGEAVGTSAITGETSQSIICAINKYIAPSVIGLDIDCLDPLMQRLHGCLIKNTSAKAAVDMAIYDVYAQNLQRPLYKILGGAKRELKTDITISVNDADEMIRDSVKAVEEGFDILKLKVGKGKGLADAQTVREIRAAVGDDVAIRVDANQGWTPKQAVRLIAAMEDMGLDIELVEQPVKAHDIDGMRFITRSVQTAILADESVFDAAQAIELIRTGAADIINIKLMKTGGIYNALKVAAVAQSLGVECLMGCMLESRLAVSAAAHFAAGLSVVTGVDLDGPLLCKSDPFVGGPSFAGSRVCMSDDYGIGIHTVPDCF